MRETFYSRRQVSCLSCELNEKLSFECPVHILQNAVMIAAVDMEAVIISYHIGEAFERNLLMYVCRLSQIAATLKKKGG